MRGERRDEGGGKRRGRREEEGLRMAPFFS
jgi:hypothetical protein